MNTNNTDLKDPKKNREYYETLDTKYMTLEEALNCTSAMATRGIPRLKWARDWMKRLKVKSFLDIGGIEGFFGIAMSQENIKSINIEPMKTAVLHGKNLVQSAHITESVRYIQGFYEDLETHKELDTMMKDMGIDRFDAIACLETLEHVLDPNHFMEWACKQAEYLIFTTPDAYGVYGLQDTHRNPGHIRLYSLNELKDFLSEYGEIIETKMEHDILLAVIKVKRKYGHTSRD
jgi:hypothetical protein